MGSQQIRKMVRSFQETAASSVVPIWKGNMAAQVMVAVCSTLFQSRHQVGFKSGSFGMADSSCGRSSPIGFLSTSDVWVFSVTGISLSITGQQQSRLGQKSGSICCGILLFRTVSRRRQDRAAQPIRWQQSMDARDKSFECAPKLCACAHH